jgi:Cu/Ag efflux protein CusF
VRYPRELRDSVERLRELPIVTERGAQIRLGDVASVRIADGPPMLKSENARLAGWVYVDIRGRDLRSAVRDMQRAVVGEGEDSPGDLGILVPASSKVTISRSPVQSLKWPAMTMNFILKDKALLDRLHAGKKIDFEFVQQGRDYVITSAE